MNEEKDYLFIKRKDISSWFGNIFPLTNGNLLPTNNKVNLFEGSQLLTEVVPRCAEASRIGIGSIEPRQVVPFSF